jgi:hypothetical protein
LYHFNDRVLGDLLRFLAVEGKTDFLDFGVGKKTR